MINMQLLSRDNFREAVFERDSFSCVICGNPGQDAHHIMERRLWDDGGYYLENGATVCGSCHLKCESTEIPVETLCAAIGSRRIVPSHLYDDQIYDKWGNPVLANGTRIVGELFYDESVQKVLAPFLDTFTHYVKYPRTHHLPWSPGQNEDDRVLQNTDQFKNKRVIVTVKMDGENTTMYSDYFHARSLDSKNHSSRNWCKNFWSTISQDIPHGWRICGENLFAQHSIHYDDLESYFMGFSVWNDRNICLSWDHTLEWFSLLGIVPVKVLYDGIFDENIIKKLYNEDEWNTCEGYVLRIADEFPYSQFRKSVAKYVRKDHISTIKHWMHGKPIVPNSLISKIVEI